MFKNVLKTLLIIFISLLLATSSILMVMSFVIIERYNTFPVPKIKISQRIRNKKTIKKTGKIYFGKSWKRVSSGITEIFVTGNRVEAGYAFGILSGKEMALFDNELFNQFDKLITNKFFQFIAGFIIIYKFNKLEDYVPDYLKNEIYALARAYEKIDKYKHRFPTYARILYYHAIHDIGQYMMEKYRIGGCTAFSAKTKNGRILHARNFDFEAGEIFDKKKAVIYYKIKGKIPFVSVAWPGMSGVVSGMNAKKIAVSLNAAGTDDEVRIGTPTSILLRIVLENASTLKQAISIIKKGKVFVSDSFLITDANTKKAVLIEKSPNKTGIIKMSKFNIGATNHFRTKVFKNDRVNKERIKYLTTLTRLKRLQVLLKKHKGNFTPKLAVKTLRDMNWINGRALAPGNRNAINAIIASHSVVFIPKTGDFYVGKPPHTLGKYVHFNLFSVLKKNNAKLINISESKFLKSSAYKKYLSFRNALTKGKTHFEKSRYQKARQKALLALGLNPNSPEALFLLAKIYYFLNNEKAFKKYYYKYLESYPPYKKNTELLQEYYKEFKS